MRTNQSGNQSIDIRNRWSIDERKCCVFRLSIPIHCHPTSNLIDFHVFLGRYIRIVRIVSGLSKDITNAISALPDPDFYSNLAPSYDPGGGGGEQKIGHSGIVPKVVPSLLPHIIVVCKCVELLHDLQ